MMEYLIVHRGDEIYRLTFKREEEECLRFLYAYKGRHPIHSIFQPVLGWAAEKVMVWLEERGFEYYWEGYHD